MLKDYDMQFISLNVKHAEVMKEYKLMFPDDPEATKLDNWHEFEKQNPETFMGMYSFWSHKSDSKNPGKMPSWIQ
jgi:hypothetical protein